jgi:FMN phosphatase YigB (HAD superfamily)
MRICDSWRHACEKVGIDAPTDELDSTTSAALLDIVKRNEVGEIDQAEFCRLAAPLLRLSARQVGRLSDGYLLGPYPGGAQLIDDIIAAGLKTACLSNTNASHWRQMIDPANPNGLPLDRMDYRFASQIMRVRKPDSAIYEQVERETGLRGPQILFFDDLLPNIEAARKRRWNAIQIRIDSDPIMQMRRHVGPLLRD